MAAIGDAYATHADYTLRFTNAIDPKRQTAIERALLDATRWITSRTHQFFQHNAAAVARIWYGDGSACLKLYGGDNCPGIAPDLAAGVYSAPSITVAIDTSLDGTYATTLTSAQYELHPLNLLFGDEPGAYKELVIPRWTTGSYSYWPSGDRVKVTAKYGYAAVPAPIRDGCIELAGILLGDSPLASRQFTDIGTVGASSEARNIVRDMIDIYREPVFA